MKAPTFRKGIRFVMRRYIDPDGRPWDVVLGRESWGMLYALFIPAGVERDEPIRQAGLNAVGYDAAQVELDTMGQDELARLFDRSQPKQS